MVTLALPIAFASRSCSVIKCPVAVYVSSIVVPFLARTLNVPLSGTGGDEVVKLLTSMIQMLELLNGCAPPRLQEEMKTAIFHLETCLTEVKQLAVSRLFAWPLRNAR